MCWLEASFFSTSLHLCLSFPQNRKEIEGRITFSGWGGCKVREEHHIKNAEYLKAASAVFFSHFEHLESII